MNELRISEHIRYIECSDDPLSADIGIIRGGDREWLFDVGNDPAARADLTDNITSCCPTSIRITRAASTL